MSDRTQVPGISKRINLHLDCEARYPTGNQCRDSAANNRQPPREDYGFSVVVVLLAFHACA